MELKQAIRALRGTERQQDFADRVGASRNSIVMWESGRFEPSVDNLRSLVRVGLDARYLVGDALDAPASKEIEAEAGQQVAS